MLKETTWGLWWGSNDLYNTVL